VCCVLFKRGVSVYVFLWCCLTVVPLPSGKNLFALHLNSNKVPSFVLASRTPKQKPYCIRLVGHQNVCITKGYRPKTDRLLHDKFGRLFATWMLLPFCRVELFQMRHVVHCCTEPEYRRYSGRRCYWGVCVGSRPCPNSLLRPWLVFNITFHATAYKAALRFFLQRNIRIWLNWLLSTQSVHQHTRQLQGYRSVLSNSHGCCLCHMTQEAFAAPASRWLCLDLFQIHAQLCRISAYIGRP
jgi:hypothetical protein